MTTQVIAQIDQIVSLLEAEIPANPNSPVNQRLEKALQRELAKYFTDLGNAFPYSKLDRLYTKYVKESLGSETGAVLDPMLATLKGKLQAILVGHLTTIYISGSAEMIAYGKTKLGIPVTYEGPPMSEAIDWAEKEGARLVTQMDEETKRRLAQVVSDGIKNKRGIPGLSRDLRKSFTDMGRYRSQLIARTETANALSNASLDRMGEMGIEGKEWVTVGDDRVSPECQGNEAEGVISTNQMFSGGVMAPPQHPNCRCSLAPARLNKQK